MTYEPEIPCLACDKRPTLRRCKEGIKYICRCGASPPYFALTEPEASMSWSLFNRHNYYALAHV